MKAPSNIRNTQVTDTHLNANEYPRIRLRLERLISQSQRAELTNGAKKTFRAQTNSLNSAHLIISMRATGAVLSLGLL